MQGEAVLGNSDRKIELGTPKISIYIDSDQGLMEKMYVLKAGVAERP